MDNFEYTKTFNNVKEFKTWEKNSMDISDMRIAIRLDKSIIVMYNVKQ